MYVYLLFIPIVLTLVTWYFTRHKFAFFEIIIPTVVVGIFISITYAIQKNHSGSSVEYNGYYVTGATYVEYWSTWVEQTCSTTTTDKDGKTHTTYYDCSYCDTNSERYYMTDSSGSNVYISKSEYDQLVRTWSNQNNKEFFIDKNRRIRKSGSCGVNGDAYSINWDGYIDNSITTTYTHRYENRIKYNRSAFNFMTNFTKEKYLYDYPRIMSNDYQTTLLGKHLLKIEDVDKLEKYLNYFNGKNGKRNSLRYYTLFFKNQDIDIAQEQQSKWLGGNQNEVNICIGLKDDGKTIDWVYVFSWQDDKYLTYKLRDELIGLKTVSTEGMYNVYDNSKGLFKWKNFNDFEYIDFIPSDGQFRFALIGTILLSIGVILFCVFNEINRDDFE